MKNLFYSKTLAMSILLCSAFLFSIASSPNIKWQKTLGGSNMEENNFGRITKLDNGNYIVVGETKSADGTFTFNRGEFDAFVIKFNSAGHVLWSKTYGGSAEDAFNGVVENNDGSLTIAGFTYSNDGDVSGNHGDRDAWVVKLSKNGTLISQHCYGGSAEDMATDMIKTSGNTYTFTGWTLSNDGDVNGNHGDNDAWVVKIKSNYTIEWSKALGGSGGEYVAGLTLSASSKILIAGSTNSINGDMNGYHGGDQDAFAMSLNQNGNIIWSKCYGGSGTDYSAFGIGVAKDGSLVIPGTSNSTDGNVTGNHGLFDGWVTKINNNNGNATWSKCFGTGISEAGYGILTMPDGDFILLGISGPTDDIFGDNLSDALAVRMNSNGNQVWSKTSGGSDFDNFEDGVALNNDDMILLGHTASYDGDVTNQHGSLDLWIVKLDNHCSNHRETSTDESISSLENDPKFLVNSTGISFSIPESQNVSFQVFDLNGRLIKTLADNSFQEGENSVEWNREDLISGIYFLQMQAGDFRKTEKIIVTN